MKTAEYLVDRPAAGIVDWPARQLFCDGVDVLDIAPRIRRDHAVADRLQRDLRALFLPEQRFLVKLALGEIHFDRRLTVDGESQTRSFEMKINPNETYTRAQTDEKGKAWMALYKQSEKTVQAILKGLEAKKKADDRRWK